MMITLISALAFSALTATVETFSAGVMLGATLFVASKSNKVVRQRLKK